eukprot:5040261-Pleurochrysis_carterae.AAC.1
MLDPSSESFCQRIPAVEAIQAAAHGMEPRRQLRKLRSIAATVTIGAARSRLLDRRRGISLAQQPQLPSSPPNDKQPLMKVFDSTLTTQKSSK